MKMRKLFIFISFFTFACATTNSDSPTVRDIIQRTKINFADVNEKILESSMIMFDGKFIQFTMKDYDQLLNQYRHQKVKELRADFEHFDKKEIYVYEKTFIACTHFTNANYTICDDPRCLGVEKAAKGGKELVEGWLRELPWGKCPRSLNSGLDHYK